MSDAVEINTKGLDQLLKALSGKTPTARVGILGDTDFRQGDAPSNASVGAQHEFGANGLPIRSFLRMPLTNYLGKALESAQLFDKEALKKVIQEGSITEWVSKIAIVAEGVVVEAFDSGGYGAWPPSDMRNKKNQQTLVETGQLRNSITWDVEE